ncbi:MAG: hypothetical protein COS34_13350 [Lysobacterales bacterium CG02_land_8_20_14_3_00_62_12]|nr:MAG: hypothetical protein COS34_13350 [Xanthomonadales bacterium CG02_land_8_20_14_3_00_62_12]
MEAAEWRVGEEHDELVFARLGLALRALGAAPPESTWGVAGSQEISEWTVDLPKGRVTVTAETYIGLTVAGPKAAVDQVRQAYDATTAR